MVNEASAPRGFRLARRYSNAQVLIFSFLAALASSVGQSFFISLFVPSIERTLQIDSGSVGTAYGLATLAGAFLLPWFGRWFDRSDLLHFAAASALIALAGSLLLASAGGAVQLALAFALLRLAGPGLLSHIAAAAPGRYFVQRRGIALAIAGLGMSAGEGLLPLPAVFAIASIGWRASLAASGILAALVTMPLAAILVRNRSRFRRSNPRKPASTEKAQSLAGFGCAIGSSLPLLVAPAALETGLIFHQGSIARADGLALSVFAAGFTIYALVQLPGSLFAGRLIDRFGSRRLLPCHALPMIAGSLVLAAAPTWWAVWLFMAGTGLTSSANSLLRTTTIVELFGRERIGQARTRLSVVFAVGNAVSPILVGLAFSGGAGAAAMLVMSSATLALAATPLLIGSIRQFQEMRTAP